MKQRQLVDFVAGFISENGYGPSYREIMRALGYNSVATVAEHVNNLIIRGHLRKRDRSARSLEVVSVPDDDKIVVKNVSEAEEKWLVEKVELYFKEAESLEAVPPNKVDELYVLVGALKVLGLEAPAYVFIRRLGELKRAKNESYSV